jgi:hypothetical protein
VRHWLLQRISLREPLLRPRSFRSEQSRRFWAFRSFSFS